jgi:hypothetical protein
LKTIYTAGGKRRQLILTMIQKYVAKQISCVNKEQAPARLFVVLIEVN